MIILTGKKVAICPISDPDTSPGGIIIPEMAKERCDQGLVKYIGPKVKDVKIGDYVVYSGYTGSLLHIEGEGRVIVMPEDFIVATLSETPNIEIPGLFYKGRINRALQHLELSNAIKAAIPGLDDANTSAIASTLSDSGFFGPNSNPFFIADYENSVEFVTKAIEETTWYKEIHISQQRPTQMDYERMRVDDDD